MTYVRIWYSPDGTVHNQEHLYDEIKLGAAAYTDDNRSPTIDAALEWLVVPEEDTAPANAFGAMSVDLSGAEPRLVVDQAKVAELQALMAPAPIDPNMTAGELAQMLRDGGLI